MEINKEMLTLLMRGILDDKRLLADLKDELKDYADSYLREIVNEEIDDWYVQNNVEERIDGEIDRLITDERLVRKISYEVSSRDLMREVYKDLDVQHFKEEVEQELQVTVVENMQGQIISEAMDRIRAFTRRQEEELEKKSSGITGFLFLSAAMLVTSVVLLIVNLVN